MTFQFMAQANHAVLLAALALLGLAGTWPVWLTARYFGVRQRGLAYDRALLGRTLAPGEPLPHVLVQLPIFNEPQLVRRVIEAAAALDWPADKLHIQILDDSTDESTAIAREVAARHRGRGLDVQLLHRAERADFKAGALRDGLRQSSCDYIALFDADYVPAPDFLRRCMCNLLADPTLAFVQARLEWLNPHQNALTRAQQIMLDGHFAVEFAMKSWCGYLMNFCGTGGIWRRAAIDDAGGWSGATLLEDADLAYRAQLRGWRALYLSGVTVPGELPDTLRTWRVQQARWAKGFSQVARQSWSECWRSELPFARKLVFAANLLVGTFGAVLDIALITGVIDVLTGFGPTALSTSLASFVVLQVCASVVAVMVVGQSTLRGAGARQSILRALASISFHIYAHMRAAADVLDGLRGKATPFVRTAKKGTVSLGTGDIRAPAASIGRLAERRVVDRD